MKTIPRPGGRSVVAVSQRPAVAPLVSTAVTDNEIIYVSHNDDRFAKKEYGKKDTKQQREGCMIPTPEITCRIHSTLMYL